MTQEEINEVMGIGMANWQLRANAFDGGNLEAALTLIKRREAELASIREAPTPCLWSEDEDGIWDTDCGNAHTFFSGGPVENSYKFCPYCGKPLEEKKYEEVEE